MLMGILRRQGEAHAVLDELDDRRGELNYGSSAFFVDTLRLYWEHRYEEALPVFRDLVAAAPPTPGVRNGYAQAAHVDEPTSTKTVVDDRGRCSEKQELGVVLQRDTLCQALHMLGEHERELEVAPDCGGPGSPVSRDPIFSKTHALAALGRVEELGTAGRAELPTVWSCSASRLAVEASAELRAHGHPEGCVGDGTTRCRPSCHRTRPGMGLPGGTWPP